MASEVAFREVKRFRQWWLWALLGIVGLVSIATSGPIGILIAGLIVVLFWSLRLVTEVRDDGLYVRFAPFHRSFRRVPWDAIESVESVKYHPLREYGGWGIRWRPGRSRSTSAGRVVSMLQDLLTVTYWSAVAVPTSWRQQFERGCRRQRDESAIRVVSHLEVLLLQITHRQVLISHPDQVAAPCRDPASWRSH